MEPIIPGFPFPGLSDHCRVGCVEPVAGPLTGVVREGVGVVAERTWPPVLTRLGIMPDDSEKVIYDIDGRRITPLPATDEVFTLVLIRHTQKKEYKSCSSCSEATRNGLGSRCSLQSARRTSPRG